MTNADIWRIAMQQSAEDIGCRAEDFCRTEPVFVDAVIGENARKYYKEPIGCNLVSYGGNVVTSVKPELRKLLETYIGKFEWYHCFEVPNLHWLNERLDGWKACFMAEYFLPDVAKLKPLPCRYEMKVLEQFDGLYTPEWSNALCEDRKHLDVLGVGAYAGRQLIALAACSADCDEMWQIGVDVLPEYRRQGIASALVSHLAIEILSRGKVPFYCCAWSNLLSMRTALKCGFAPAWVEMTVKPSAFVDQMNA